MRNSIWWLLIGLLLTVSQPTRAQAIEPREIVAAFLDAWNDQDSAVMYSYLSSKSQELYVQQVFENRYQLAKDAIDLTGVIYTIHEVEIQGFSATVTYDIVLESSSFGEIADNGRTMRLVQIGGKWGIAWTTMDIFDALSGNSSLVSSGTLPPRANIYDRNGNPIAYQGTMVATWTAKQNMTSEQDCQSLLAEITRRPFAAFVSQFIGYAPETVFFLIELDQDTYNEYSDQLGNICGVDTTRTYTTRVYYKGNAMTHVVGYIGLMSDSQVSQYTPLGFTPGDLIGQMGVEQAYQSQLAGTPQRVLRIIAPGGVPTLRELGGKPGTDPTPIMLTIDRDLQVATADALADAFDYAAGNWGPFADAGAAVVLKIDTGEILAMASYPLVDPMLFNPASLNEFRGTQLAAVVSDPRSPLTNHALQNQYGPGSVYKVITSVALLNEDIVQPDTEFFCDAVWNGRSDWTITDGLDATGDIIAPQAITASCNPFFWEFGSRLYNQKGNKVVEYSQEMGLGQAYNIFRGAINEVPGNLDNPRNVDEAINTAIGQGDVQLPPIQMAVAAAAIANDGTVYKPYLVRQIGGFDGTESTQEFAPEILNTLELQEDVLPTVREGMCDAVTDRDLGTAYYVFNETRANPNYTACGKTGTAEAGERSNAWFIAYAPAENPQIAIVVAIPRAGREGSEIAAPIARRILDYYFNSTSVDYPEWWRTEPFDPLDIPVGGGGN